MIIEHSQGSWWALDCCVLETPESKLPRTAVELLLDEAVSSSANGDTNCSMSIFGPFRVCMCQKYPPWDRPLSHLRTWPTLNSSFSVTISVGWVNSTLWCTFMSNGTVDSLRTSQTRTCASKRHWQTSGLVVKVPIQWSKAKWRSPEGRGIGVVNQSSMLNTSRQRRWNSVTTKTVSRNVNVRR